MYNILTILINEATDTRMKKDLVGKRFGRLIVLAEAEPKIQPSGQVKTRWSCACDCGGQVAVTASNLQQGITLSCGCYHKEKTSIAKTTHGCSKKGRWTHEYTCWAAMIQRCTNKNAPHYDRYGGRGIKVCEEWMVFECFLADMGESNDDSLTLGRINNDGDYEPGNVRWETKFQQANNKSTSRMLTVNGKTQTIAQWSVESGISQANIGARVRVRGWSDHSAVTIPVSTSNKKLKLFKNLHE